MNPDDFTGERARRFEMLAQLKAVDPNLKRIPASVVREVGAYGQYRGTFAEVVSTDDGIERARVTVGVLHTGRHYADDLSAHSLIYHYPQTRTPGRDRTDIDAGKSAMLFKLPVFIVFYPTVGDSNREVRLGYIVEADDANRQFLIRFGETRPPASPALDEVEFEHSVLKQAKKRRTVQARANDQARFAFDVAKRYGKKCAVCSIRREELLDAAHIVPVANLGSDDARNGLPLCKNHHRAFDAALFCIGSEGYTLVPKHDLELSAIGITETRVVTLTKAMPHLAAIFRCNELRQKPAAE